MRLDAGRCAPLAGPELEAQGPAWKAFASYAQRCPVAGPDGRPVLNVDIVRLDRAYAAHLFNARPDLTSPNPVLREASGFHRRIELYEAGESAVSPQLVPPMHWDAKANACVWPMAPQRLDQAPTADSTVGRPRSVSAPANRAITAPVPAAGNLG